MKLLTREQILAADDIKHKTVNVPEWGGDVIIKTMSGRERDALEVATVESNKPAQGTDEQDEAKRINSNLTNFRAKLVARTAVDEQDQRIFGDEDVEALGDKSAPAMCRLYDVSVELNKVSQADIEELAKNSEAALSDDSGSNSPDI